MSIRKAKPLPECGMCEIPTARATFLRLGGVCSSCNEEIAGVAATVRMARLPPAPDQFDDNTVIVEGYRPPVPGQLRIDGEH